MSVRLVEVGPRDGLQNIKTSIPTATKLELIRRLHQCGLRTIEATSIVSPKAVPQLADCRQILSSEPVRRWLQTENNLRLPVLVPNTRGLDIAIEYGVREIAVFISATEGFSRANINCTVEQGIERAKTVAARAIDRGIAVRGYVSCIFADPFDGPTLASAVYRVTKELLDAGCYEVSLGDTLGVGTAAEVGKLIEYLKQQGIDIRRLAGHFHDTYGQALANVWEAYKCGITTFDASVGGLGGCPFAPGAKGNVATEDLVYLFQAAGIKTGVDLAKLVQVGVWISGQLGKSNDSRAGTALWSKSKSIAKPAASQFSQKDAPPLTWEMVRESPDVLVYRSGANGKVVLNRPRNGNALTLSMIGQLTDAFKSLEQDRSISRIVLAANGKFFCTGMDLGRKGTAVGSGNEAREAMFDGLTELLRLIDDCTKVTIACINGPVFGGGIGLAFACDIRISTKSATFTLSEVKLGLCPAVISKYVIREWGVGLSREAMLTARPVTAPELKAAGAVLYVPETLDELQERLHTLLQDLRRTSPSGTRMSKQLIKLGWVHGGKTEQQQGISELFRQMMQPGTEGSHGVKEFQEGRKVDWDSYTILPVKAKI